MRTPALSQFRTELLRAAELRTRPAGSDRRRRRALPLLAAGLAMLVLGGGTAAAITVLSDAPDDPYDPAPEAPRVIAKAHALTPAERKELQRRRRAGAPVVDARRYFAVLKRPATAEDRIPGRAEQPGVRLTASGPPGRVYIRPTARETCVVFQRGRGPGSSGSCAPTASARTRGVIVFEQCFKTGPPQHRLLAGVVPDGVRTVSVSRGGARQASARVEHNGFTLDTIQPFDTIELGRARIRVPPVTC